MKLENLDSGSLESVVLADEIGPFTIHTSSGSFRVQEDKNGALHIHESTHRTLSVRPRHANAIILEAVER